MLLHLCSHKITIIIQSDDDDDDTNNTTQIRCMLTLTTIFGFSISALMCVCIFFCWYWYCTIQYLCVSFFLRLHLLCVMVIPLTNTHSSTMTQITIWTTKITTMYYINSHISCIITMMRMCRIIGSKNSNNIIIVIQLYHIIGTVCTVLVAAPLLLLLLFFSCIAW